MWLRNAVALAAMLVVVLSQSIMVGAVDEKKVSNIEFISVDELRTKVSSNEPVIIIDVRNSENYANSDSRIKGAIHVVVRKLKYRLNFPPLSEVPKDREVVTYCACPSEEASIQAAQLLLESGFKRVRALKGGWREWQKAKGPIEPRPRG